MTVTLIDTHAHLDDERFQNDRDAVLHRAKAAGVAQVISIATSAGTSQIEVDLAARHETVFATVGIQPNHVAEVQPGDWDEVVRLAPKPKVVGLGETGLDRYWDRTPFPQQEDYFARHLSLSRQTGLPVVIHCREAEADTVQMLRDDYDRNGPVRGVMHSFTGDLPTATACLAMGLHISFAGMLTYKNAADLRAVAAQVPLDRLLVETDSPYLVPIPLRGKEKRNEPAHVRHTAECLANLHGVALADMAAHTTQNARSLFRLPG